jgi:5'-deoxynucleotidase YfbR-like HD superfamily hydrolase
MENIANLLFEAKMLKEIPRSGFQFLGAGKESVAEHVFMTTFIAFAMSKLNPDIDHAKLMTMCLVHDLPEARMGDLNAVQKKYVTADEEKAISHLIQNIPFGNDIALLMKEFNEGVTKEAQLAYDADQLSLLMDLKALQDIGLATPPKWIEHVQTRFKTKTGQKLAMSILQTEWDHWWLKDFEKEES